ncbi:MAG: MalM family protein [Marinobacter sp.]|nr:MalM family protein [Marinobacter sp.]
MPNNRFPCAAILTVTMALVVLVGCQADGSSPSSREGYFTWVDDKGRVQHSRIIRESEPESEVSTPGKDHSEQSGSADDSEFNLENYPDGNELERRGYVRPGEPQPYFTWQDAEGNIRTSYYQPDTRSEVEKGRIKPPVKLTPASIYQRSNSSAPVVEKDHGDPDAFAILGIDSAAEGFLERWSEHCCENLSLGDAADWHSDREFGLTLDEGTPVHEFMTGGSPYGLIRIPAGGEKRDFIMRLRSFARDGLFVPSVAFLDANMRPVRMVTDLVAEYVPETWHRRGYLEAFIPVFPGHGERWMVLFTRGEDLRGQTVIEDKRGPRAIQHSLRGELGVAEVRER